MTQTVPGATEDAAPLLVSGPGPGVLCLHGFSGTPFEVKPLAEGLARQGFSVSAPLLAGHGISVDALAETRWPDWVASAAESLDSLIELTGRPVAICGFSMGGLLALHLARLRPHDIAALVVMAAPLRMRSFHRRAIMTLAHLPKFLRMGPLAAIPKWNGFDVSDDGMKARNPGLPALPVPAVASLVELGTVVRGDVPHVKCPTLVVHGEQDHTIPMDDSLELVGSLGSSVIERLWLPRSYHLLCLDVERATVVEKAARFLTTHLPARPRPEVNRG